MTTPYVYSEYSDESINPAADSIVPRRENVLASLALDRAAVIVVPVAAVLLPSGVSWETLFTLAVAASVWSLALRGSYSRLRRSALALGTGVITAVGTVSGLAALSLLDFWLPGFGLSFRQLLLMTAGVLVASSIFEAVMQGPTPRRRLLLLGADEGIRELLEELAMDPGLPFEVIGIVDDEEAAVADGVPRLGTTGELALILREQRPDLVVLGSETRREEALSHLLDVAPNDVRVVDVHHFNEHAFGKVPVRHLSPVWFMSVVHLYQQPYSRFVKRTFDLLVAGVALFVLAPVLLALVVIVRASSPGPVFYRQLRLGEGGKLFEMLKYRTMIDGAEEPGVAVWAKSDDTRVTPVGRALRRTRLDELPQFWNVLRGDMSIVGPRPERPEFLELLSETVPFWTRRHLVKPGITGWAQLRRGYTSDASGTAEKLAYDLYYLKYRSLLLDLAILSRTARIVFSGFGSR